MQITLNGQKKHLDAPTTVRGLLQRLSLEPLRVAVEINEDLVSRKRFDEVVIKEDDRVEIVTFVGGG